MYICGLQQILHNRILSKKKKKRKYILNKMYRKNCKSSVSIVFYTEGFQTQTESKIFYKLAEVVALVRFNTTS